MKVYRDEAFRKLCGSTEKFGLFLPFIGYDSPCGSIDEALIDFLTKFFPETGSIFQKLNGQKRYHY